MEEIEIWKDIPKYEGLYQVSNFGNVKSLPRNTTKGKILKQCKNKDGYLKVALYENGKRKFFFIHRLVALAFIPNDNPIEKTEINHIDENKHNNNVSNLCWCSHIDNVNYGTRNKRIRKSILQFSLSGKFIKEFNSAKQASEELGINSGNIAKCCKGKQKSCGGFIWKYKENNTNLVIS